jgi:hypothetical protein
VETTWFMFGKCRLAVAMKHQRNSCVVQSVVTPSENTVDWLIFSKVIKALTDKLLSGENPNEKRQTVN